MDEIKNYKLTEEIKKKNLPKHVAVIMDGNRRFAYEHNLIPEYGHILGKEKIKDLLEWCFELGIPILTVYAFSLENFNRNEKEIENLMNMFREEIKKAKEDSRIHRNKVRIKVIGRIDLLPHDLQESTKELTEATKNYSDYHLNIALAYGGREEILQAIQRIASDVKDKRLDINNITESTVSSYLYTNGLPDPDLILRTSGEERVSNFLLWQLAYSELYFSDVYWPAFEKKDFLKAVKTYQNRQRRYGQ
ncbi:MAG: polyprenyl diphosphate synthase [Candidatus Thermoplasmatota archaeon]